MGDTIRTFIAAVLPVSVRNELGRVQAELKKERFKFRWVKPERIHLTLAFLGEVDKGRLAAVSDAMANGLRFCSPLQLKTNGLGVFPTIKRPRVFWAGIGEEVDRLRALKASLDQSLLKVPDLVFKPEPRPFKAHLTLGRAKGRIDGPQLAAAMIRLQPLLSTRFTMTQVHLFKSDLCGGGAVYTQLSSIELG